MKDEYSRIPFALFYIMYNVQACTEISDSGIITSPNYPEDYDGSLDICWILRVTSQKVSIVCKIVKSHVRFKGRKRGFLYGN